MRLLEIGMYIIVIIIVMLLFQQIVNILYDLSLAVTVGEINALLYLGLIWAGLYIFIRFIFTMKKKKRSELPKYVGLGGVAHITICLAIFCYNTNPLLLLSFPIIIAVLYKIRSSNTLNAQHKQANRPVHPYFVDERNGTCIIRTGSRGFTMFKFFNLFPPFMIRDFLLFLYHEQIECVLEVQKNAGSLEYQLVIITRGRNYDMLFERCSLVSSSLKQFFHQEEIIFEDQNDPLNILHKFYAPYFIYATSALNSGVPLEFPKISFAKNEISIDLEFEEFHFSVSKILPKSPIDDFFEFLETIDEDFFYQIHFRPLNDGEISIQEEQYNQEYRGSLKRLTEGLEDDVEFTAANYLFTSLGQTSKENIEPLLNQSEINRLKTIKRQIQHIKLGREIGMWELESYLIGSPVLAKTISIKLEGHIKKWTLTIFSK